MVFWPSIGVITPLLTSRIDQIPHKVCLFDRFPAATDGSQLTNVARQGLHTVGRLRSMPCRFDDIGLYFNPPVLSQ